MDQKENRKPSHSHKKQGTNSFEDMAEHKPENQNQDHNIKKEALGPNTKR